MVRLQLLTGTRPQEVMSLKPCEIKDGGNGVWFYTPSTHKTEHHGRDKVIVLGPLAQEVLKPWLHRSPSEYCFVPSEAMAWMRARRRKKPSVSNPCPTPSGLNPRYTRHSYRVAVQRACAKAKVPKWCPLQLRHTRATQIRAAFGSIEAAKAVLGHTDTRITEIYAERDLGLATKVMKEIG